MELSLLVMGVFWSQRRSLNRDKKKRKAHTYEGRKKRKKMRIDGRRIAENSVCYENHGTNGERRKEKSHIISIDRVMFMSGECKEKLCRIFHTSHIRYTRTYFTHTQTHTNTNAHSRHLYTFDKYM